MERGPRNDRRAPAGAPPLRPPRAGEAGFSLLEALIAAALLLLVVLGVIPLFTQAMVNNLHGETATTTSVGAAEDVETAFGDVFDSRFTEVPAGSTELSALDYFAEDTRAWVTAAPSGQPALYRSRNVQQYSLSDLEDPTQPYFHTPLDGTTDPIYVHVKLVDTHVGKFRNNTTGVISGPDSAEALSVYAY